MRPKTAKTKAGLTVSVVNIPPLLPPVNSPEAFRLPTPLTPSLWSHHLNKDFETTRSSNFLLSSTRLRVKEAVSPRSDVSSPVLSARKGHRPYTSRQRFPAHRIAIGYSGKAVRKPVHGKAGIRPLLYVSGEQNFRGAKAPLSSMFSLL